MMALKRIEHAFEVLLAHRNDVGLGRRGGRFLMSVTSPSANSILVEPDLLLALKSKEKAAGLGRLVGDQAEAARVADPR